MKKRAKSISVPCTLICAFGLSLLFTGCTATSIDGMRRPAVERIGGYPDRAANELNLPYRKRVDELFQNGGRLNSELNTRKMARDSGGLLESQSLQRNFDNLKEEQAFLKRKIADMNRDAQNASTGNEELLAISRTNDALRKQLESQSSQIDSLMEQIATLQNRVASQQSSSQQWFSDQQSTSRQQAPRQQQYSAPQQHYSSQPSTPNYSEPAYSPPSYSPPAKSYSYRSEEYNPPSYEAPYRAPPPATVYVPPEPRYTKPPVTVYEEPEIVYEAPTIIHDAPVYREPEPLYAPQVVLPRPGSATVPGSSTPAVVPRATIPTVTTRPSQHKVRPGEFLSTIASRYSVSMPEILAANPGIDPNRLRVGQLVKIP